MGHFRSLCCLFPKVLTMSSDIGLNSWCVTAAPWDRRPGLCADFPSPCCGTRMATRHLGTLRQEGKVGKCLARLGKGLGF